MSELQSLLDNYRREGRSTPGPVQENDPPLHFTETPMNPSRILSLATIVLLAASALAETPLTELLDQAKAGDANAQLDLAIRYRDGKGVAKDDAAAMQWAHRAADAGNADAMDFVGFAYLRGAVVKRSPEIAFGYFKAAAEKSAQAAFNLGQCYFGAQGTEQDCAKALDWWKKAAAERPRTRGVDGGDGTAFRRRRRARCGGGASARRARGGVE